MDAKEGMACRGEHRISVVDNAGRFRKRVGTGIHEEEVTIPAIEPSLDEGWIGGLQEKIVRVLTGPQQPSWLPDDKREDKICKFTLGEEFCRPRVVTIGPYHRDNEYWRRTQMVDCGLDESVVRTRRIKQMDEQIEAAFKCYSYSDISQSFDIKDDKKRFAEMLLLDSYFILFMLTYTNVRDSMHRGKLKTEQYPPALHRASDIDLQKDKIILDLLILDNQIPFFVIEELFKELKLGKQPLHKYALDFFEMIHPRSTQGRRNGQNRPHKFSHLLHLFHWSRIPEKIYHSQPCPSLDSLDYARYTPTARELREYATMFKKKMSGSSLDITFRRGRLLPVIGLLNIPSLHIRDYSSLIFHNLIAFEMQCPRWDRHTMAFSAFMHNLLQSEEDVKELRGCGILASTSMTANELVSFFKSLSQLIENYPLPEDPYSVHHDILFHHNRRTSRFCSSVILRYFPNPLVTLSVFGAVTLFVLTLLQTIYSMVDNYKYQ